MKQSFVYIVFVIFLVSACNSQNTTGKKETPTDSLINNAGGNTDSSYERGARLVATSDCLSCHQLDKKSVGPSYYLISEKYPFDTGVVENLAHSIIHGSKGLYGSNAMTPHPNLSYNDAKAMASYILSLKKVPSTHPNKK